MELIVDFNFRYALDAFLNELPNCINRELIDNAAVDFVLNLNTKNNRKKLTRVLFSVARTRLDLLPFYSRFAAILYPVLPDVCVDLCAMLKQDFKYHVRKKDQINIESKVVLYVYLYAFIFLHKLPWWSYDCLYGCRSGGAWFDSRVRSSLVI